MQADIHIADRISFGPFTLWPGARLLKQDDEPVRIGERALNVLITLIEHQGVVLSKETLTRTVWKRQWLDDSNLRVAIAAIRKALGDKDCSYIINVPGEGYSFSAKVELSLWSAHNAAGKPTAAIWRSENLPLPARVFGREADAEAVLGLFNEGRFVTVTGPAGMGKTTLALIAAKARCRCEKIRVVDLSPLPDNAAVVSTVAEALGAERGVQDAASWLRDSRGEEPVFLVLDNCEHLADAAALLAERLLRNHPAMHILATSREPLRTPSEAVYRLEGLACPPGCGPQDASAPEDFPAAALFTERVRATCPEALFHPSWEACAREICQRLDGIPLALELAAIRVASLGLDGLIDGIDNRFDILTLGYRTAPARHQSLEAAFTWGHQLLTEAEQDFFLKLARLPLTFSLTAVVEITGLPAPYASTLLACLIDKSLVTTESTGDERHFSLLETVRAFALMQIARSRACEIGPAGQSAAINALKRVPTERAGIAILPRPTAKPWQQSPYEFTAAE